ncbi:MAG: PA domain-containing protein, partial [Deltaproteobacteria bacterium]
VKYSAFGLEFSGTTDANGISGTAYDCGMGYPDQFPTAVRGNIAIIERGNRDGKDFYFSNKVRNAQIAGALGVILYNNVVVDFSGTLSNPGTPPWVPVVSITKANGEALKAIVNPSVTIVNMLTGSPYYLKSGTSMAVPQVAGIAGLTLAQCPSLGYAAIKSALLNTVDKIPAVADKMVSGGRVNAFAALASILAPGDLTGDCRIGLDDAILALQIVSGLPPQLPYFCPSCGKGLNGNSEIGLPEAIFILQKVAGMRQ